MAISLSKGQKISLKKENGGKLEKVIMGLGWNAVDYSAAQKPAGGIAAFLGFGSRPKKTETDIDLDASCLLFDDQKEVVDTVYFGQLKSDDGSIQHTGDNRTGEGEGDDEQIVVNLSAISANVSTIVFTVNSYSGQTFKEIESAYCRLVDAGDNKELARYTLRDSGDCTAMIMVKLYRHNGEWKLHAMGEPGEGRTIRELGHAVQTIL